MYRHIFGPVNSRRLGRSLGVDLTPGKVCCFNCAFCQAGETADLTLQRKDYVSVDEVLDELCRWFKSGGTADYVTLSGSGEPALHLHFGRVLRFVRETSSIRTALLSNGSLFQFEEVRSDALNADVVKVSLSAWDQESFEAVNRPHSGLRFSEVVRGMESFRAIYGGEYWLEIVFIEGVNDSPAAVEKISGLARTIAPDRIHLNTVTRSPAVKSVRGVSPDVLRQFSGYFSPAGEPVVGDGLSGTETGEFVGVRPLK